MAGFFFCTTQVKLKGKMKFFNECYPCLLRQVIGTAKLLDLNDRQTKVVLHKAMEYLLEDRQNIMPLHIVEWVNTFIRTTFYDGSDTFDPYKELKHHSNLLALHNSMKLEDMVTHSSSPLETAIAIAAVGNIIDFGAKEHGSIDINHEIENMHNLSFSIYHYNELYEKLTVARNLLYIGDNAGEIVFDKVLIREMKRAFPGLNIIFTVRDRPIINDATIDDARIVGMDKEVTVISSGSIYPGTILEETSKEFRDIFESADGIIAKGQGNLESLCDISNENLFFILRIKCDRIADIIGAKSGDMILLQKK